MRRSRLEIFWLYFALPDSVYTKFGTDRINPQSAQRHGRTVFIPRLYVNDMQNDTVIFGFSSYLLNDTVGERGTVSEITSVVVNGQELGVCGYIDIGLRDTMLDLIMCLFGSVGVCCAAKFSKKPMPPMIEGVRQE